MFSFKTVCIAGASSLALFFGFLWWWGGRVGEPSVQHPSFPITAPSLPVQVQAARPRKMSDVNLQSVTPKSAGNEAAAAESAPALPVLMHFYRRLRDPDRRIEGSVENMSNEDLSITLSVVSVRTGTSSQSILDVPPQGRVVFGRDDGLNLGEGDQITLQGRGYGDLQQEIGQIH